MTDIDEKLRQAMRQAGTPAGPPAHDLVAGGIARGERMRRRHRLNLAGGAVAAAAMAAAAVVVVPQLSGSPAGDGDTVAGPGEGQPVLDEDVVVDTALGLLPPGEISDVRSGSGGDLQVWFEVVFDDGEGPSLIQGSARVIGDVAAFECGVIANGGSCDARSLDDGTELMSTVGPYYPQADREPDRLLWSVAAARPDGLSIILGEINAPTEAGSPVSRPEPPLTVDELTAIVTSDRWPEADQALRDAAAELARAEAAAEELADVAERADQQQRGEALAADLGPGWVISPDENVPGGAVPGPEAADGLPHADAQAVVYRWTYGAGEAQLAELCGAGGCVESTSPDGDPILIKRNYTETGVMVDDPSGQVQHSLTVLHLQGDGSLVSVALRVTQAPGTSTPDADAAVAEWLDDHVDAPVRAAVVGGLETD